MTIFMKPYMKTQSKIGNECPFLIQFKNYNNWMKCTHADIKTFQR